MWEERKTHMNAKAKVGIFRPRMSAVGAFVIWMMLLLVRGSASPADVGHIAPVGLRFSAVPTTEELIGAHVFEEPLIPVGGEPSPIENADLADALRGYAQRQGPDDFGSLRGF